MYHACKYTFVAEDIYDNAYLFCIHTYIDFKSCLSSPATAAAVRLILQSLVNAAPQLLGGHSSSSSSKAYISNVRQVLAIAWQLPMGQTLEAPVQQ